MLAHFDDGFDGAEVGVSELGEFSGGGLVAVSHGGLADFLDGEFFEEWLSPCGVVEGFSEDEGNKALCFHVTERVCECFDSADFYFCVSHHGL